MYEDSFYREVYAGLRLPGQGLFKYHCTPIGAEVIDGEVTMLINAYTGKVWEFNKVIGRVSKIQIQQLGYVDVGIACRFPEEKVFRFVQISDMNWAKIEDPENKWRQYLEPRVSYALEMLFAEYRIMEAKVQGALFAHQVLSQRSN